MHSPESEIQTGPSNRLAVLAALTTFVGAFLLFQVQPIVSKTILPWFGGSPAVWTTCLLFFQCALLGGYAYAHAINHRRFESIAAPIHCGLLLVAVVGLWLTRPDDFRPESSVDPTRKILWLLSVSIGLPYFMLSTTGPLVQAWFARVYATRSPYRLYALSNIGSLVALLSYPLLIERTLSLETQDFVWSSAFVLYCVLCASLAIGVWRYRSQATQSSATSDPGSPAQSIATTQSAAITDSDAAMRSAAASQSAAAMQSAATAESLARRDSGAKKTSTKKLQASASSSARRASPKSKRRAKQRAAEISHRETIAADANAMLPAHWTDPLVWVLLPALASMMLLAITNHLSQNVAVIPMLWIAPLSLYLISFIICFDRHHWYLPRWFALFTVMAVLWLANLIIAKHFPVMYPDAIVQMPLSDWRDWLGGQLAAYLSGLFLICMVCHGEVVLRKPPADRLTLFYLSISAGGALGGLLVAIVFPWLLVTYAELASGLLVALLLSAAVFWRDGWSRWLAGNRLLQVSTWIVAGVGSGVVLWALYLSSQEPAVVKLRNFYGLIAVKERYGPGNPNHCRVLYHGDTFHGLQFLSPQMRRSPTLYFAPNTGCGYVLQSTVFGENRRVGVVGLGAGTMAAYGRAGDYFRFYEIDPEVRDVANEYFTFLKDSPAKIDVVVGDGRLAMQQEPASLDLDVIILDAFSGDAIPAHLLTTEAFEQYQRHLRDPDKAVLAFHISNRYLDLSPIVNALGIEYGYRALQFDQNHADTANRFAACTWIVLTRNPDFIKDPSVVEASFPIPAERARLWTDGRNNLWEAFK